MKSEKEIVWIVNLLHSKFIKRKISKSLGGCKSDFERCAGASENNKEFRRWIDELIHDRILEFLESRTNVGKEVPLYVINESKLIKRLANIEDYKLIKDIAIKDYWSLGLG